MLDLVLRGGTVVDGTGSAPEVADVGIRDGRIVAVGPADEPARTTLDVSGRVVCPGFIDIHTHYDAQLLWDPTASPSVLHGVTTVLGGNCGFSIAPLRAGDAAYIQRMMAVVEGIPLEALEGGGAWEWTSFGQYLDRIDVGLAVNAGFLVGHSTVRRAVMGEAATEDAATPDQLDAMVGSSASRWPGGRSGSPRRSEKAMSTGTAARFPPGWPPPMSWSPWPVRCGTIPAPPSSSSRRWGPSPRSGWS